MTTATAYGVRCGNHGTERIYHATLEEVRGCYRDAQYMAHQDRVAREPVQHEVDLSVFDAPVEPTRVYRSEVPLDEDGIYRNPQTG